MTGGSARSARAARGVERRPSGDRPPLPRQLHRADYVVLALVGVAMLLWLAVFASDDNGIVVRRLDQAVIDAAAELRTPWLVSTARAIADVAHEPFASLLALGLVAAVVTTRRLRRGFVVLGCFVVAETFVSVVQPILATPRPYGVTIEGEWRGYASPSYGITLTSVVVFGAVFVLLPSGKPRRWGFLLAGALLLLVAAANVLLGVEYPTDALVSVAFPAAVVVLGFRLFAPDIVFPVQYRRGRSAHLDLGGPRGEAIRRAVREQLGLDVLDVEPFGQAGSGGSSPMRLRVDGAEPRWLFAKLYAQQHVRADRWYKFGRTLLYGRLEDERPFSTVRRLVQYEDYLLRVMRDAGLPVVEPYGFVELTPEREYLLVTAFADGARELGDPDVIVDDALVDEGIAIVRTLWDAGLAHRDVKPANLLVRDGHLVVIDVAFAQIRPSPWRQAVDLANMMLCLALRSEPQLVYDRARRRFTDDEIAEAFAATRGMTVPSQLRAMLRADPRPLVAELRALAPPRPPVRIQRWSVRRIGLLAATVLGVVLGALLLWGVVYSQDPDEVAAPNCPDSSPVQLFAQAVPTATAVPCLEPLPAGWEVSETRARNGQGSVAIELGVIGELDLRFTAGCRPGSDARPAEVPAGSPDGARALLEVEPGAAETTAITYVRIEGGCLRQSLTLDDDAGNRLATEVSSVVAWQTRAALDAAVERATDGRVDRL